MKESDFDSRSFDSRSFDDSGLLDSKSFDSTSFSESFRAQSSMRSGELKIIDRASGARKRADAKMSAFTINKLKIKSIGLVGREKETEILQDRLHPLVQQANTAADTSANIGESSDTGLVISHTKKELIFIKGFSGVGKTSLAKVVKKEVNSTNNGFFAEGKFDLDDSKDEPYSGIAKAYSELIGELWRKDRKMLFGIGQKLCEILRSDAEPLTYLIPELENVVTEYSTMTFQDDNMDGMQERWKYSFRVLTRLLTAKVKPLVLVIDDLQWADKASLDLIECLITDSQNVNPLMVIGCYRSNEVDETSQLTKSIQSLMREKEKFRFEVTEIALDSCGKKDVNEMIMKMTDTDDEARTQGLADLCYQRTLGNPFFVIEFMSMLQREGLMDFSLGTMKWTYDVSRIEAETMSTANVVELLQNRMKRMDADAQLLLSIAACVGPTFRVSILELLWKHLANQYAESNDGKVPALIELLEGEMLIERSFGDKYRWVHDKVQEAALSLLNVEHETLKFQMGAILYVNLEAKELDDELFDVADLISSGKGRETSADFATLFLQAATKAVRLSAFQSSSKYVKSGIEMLPSDMWRTYQSLALSLHSLGARVELELGNAAESKKYCEAVCEREDVHFDSKLPLRLADIKRLSTVELNYGGSIQAALQLLKDLDFKFRWNRTLVGVQALSLVARTAKDIKRQPKDFFQNIGRMNKKYSTIAEVLARISYASHHTQEFMQMILCMCHVVQLTLQHGLCQQSAPNMALVGGLSTKLLKKPEDAPLFREVALSTQSIFGRTFASQTLFIVHVYSLSWSLQTETIARPLFQGYIFGMQNGEVDFAMHCLYTHSTHLPYFLGKPIDQILEECPKIVTQTEELSQKSQMNMTKIFWQMCLHLRNPQQTPFSLEGEIHNVEACEGENYLTAWHDFSEFQLLFFYNDPSAADRAIKSLIETASRSYFMLMIDAFHRCVCLYRAARRTKKRKYRGHAKKIRNTIHNWKQMGNPNVVYYCIFLDAEQAALEGKLDEAESLYKKAIQFVGRSGYLHHAALFNEVYSDFLYEERKDRDEAKYRLEEAIRYYQDWGAHGVVERLRASHLLQ